VPATSSYKGRRLCCFLFAHQIFVFNRSTWFCKTSLQARCFFKNAKSSLVYFFNLFPRFSASSIVFAVSSFNFDISALASDSRPISSTFLTLSELIFDALTGGKGKVRAGFITNQRLAVDPLEPLQRLLQQRHFSAKKKSFVLLLCETLACAETLLSQILQNTKRPSFFCFKFCSQNQNVSPQLLQPELFEHCTSRLPGQGAGGTKTEKKQSEVDHPRRFHANCFPFNSLSSF